jgi:outer membrane protein assembly factor BamD (BamD/ComL family)
MPVPRTRSLLRLALLACLALATACAGNPVRKTGQVPRKLTPEEVPAAIQNAEQALAEGRSDLALEWSYVASRVEGLPTEQRNRVQFLMERAADERVAQLAAGEGDPEELASLVDVGLPRQVAVTAGIRAAEALVREGEYKRAFEVIREVDDLYPRHHERAAAGSLLADIGLGLSYRKTGWWIFGRSRPKAYEALEYLVLNYPLDDRCAEAYWRLGEMYEEDGKWQTGIERLQELVVYHPRSPYVAQALARIPRLRLQSIESPEYDRKALVLARNELDQWLDVYAGSELEPEVREDLDDALRRLAQSDIVIAKFYRTVGNTFGARYHATRAIEEADRAGDEDRAERARDIVASLPEEEKPVEVIGEVPIADDPRGEAVRE